MMTNIIMKKKFLKLLLIKSILYLLQTNFS